MGLLDFFKNNKNNVNWDAVKTTSEAYPENSISLVMVQSESGLPATGWVNLGYVDNEFKKNCAYNFQFTVEIEETDKDGNDLDMLTVENYLTDILKKGCIAHPVARVATDFGFIMDFYVDDADFAAQTLQEVFEDENKLVEFGCGINHDPKWKEYRRITRLTN